MVEVSESDIRARCTRFLADALARPVEQIDPNVTFARLGVDSAMAAFLWTELEDWLGMELAPDVVFEYPTIAELSRHLARLRGGAGDIGNPVG